MKHPEKPKFNGFRPGARKRFNQKKWRASIFTNFHHAFCTWFGTSSIRQGTHIVLAKHRHGERRRIMSTITNFERTPARGRQRLLSCHSLVKISYCGAAPPLQMCDALSRNLPKLPQKLEVIVGHCLAHARRRFVEVTPNFPQPCQHVLEQLGKIYGNDALTREQGLTPDERLRFHQRQSGPVMDQLHAWLTAQFAEKKVEPNSGLGMAMRYLLKYWERLTLFLRQPGAPLDNNICERALKKAILHRKNSLFYKTENGARVGDLFMSLIHTCKLCGANPFDYLTQLQRHGRELARNPSEWMPWNYPASLEQSGASLDSG